MAVNTVNIVPVKQIEAVQTTQYVSANAKTIIDKMTVTNVTANVVALSVNVVPPAGSASSANLVISAKSIAPGEVYQCPELVGHTLENNYFISAIASAGTSLNLDISGRVIT